MKFRGPRAHLLDLRLHVSVLLGPPGLNTFGPGSPGRGVEVDAQVLGLVGQAAPGLGEEVPSGLVGDLRLNLLGDSWFREREQSRAELVELSDTSVILTLTSERRSLSFGNLAVDAS